MEPEPPAVLESEPAPPTTVLPPTVPLDDTTPEEDDAAPDEDAIPESVEVLQKATSNDTVAAGEVDAESAEDWVSVAAAVTAPGCKRVKVADQLVPETAAD